MYTLLHLNFATRIKILDETEREPSADESLRDRIVLDYSDDVKFFTHASVVCRFSTELNKFYHHDRSVDESDPFEMKGASTACCSS